MIQRMRLTAWLETRACRTAELRCNQDFQPGIGITIEQVPLKFTQNIFLLQTPLHDTS